MNGDIVIGSIMEPGQTAYFVLEAYAGALYEIETTNYGLQDPYLYIYARDGTTVLASDDDGGDDTQSRITFTFPSTDPYIIGVRSTFLTGVRATGSTGVSAYAEPPSVMDTCSPNPCQNDATCFAEPYIFHCTCVGEWQGATCSVPLGAEEINMCGERSGTSIENATIGFFTDGVGNYQNSASCTLSLTPIDGTWLTLGFTEFSTESGYDSLQISTGSWSTTLEGNSIPDSMTIESSETVAISFTSDSSMASGGFVGFYFAAPIPPPPPPPPPCEDDLTGELATQSTVCAEVVASLS